MLKKIEEKGIEAYTDENYIYMKDPTGMYHIVLSKDVFMKIDQKFIDSIKELDEIIKQEKININ